MEQELVQRCETEIVAMPLNSFMCTIKKIDYSKMVILYYPGFQIYKKKEHSR